MPLSKRGLTKGRLVRSKQRVAKRKCKLALDFHWVLGTEAIEPDGRLLKEIVGIRAIASSATILVLTRPGSLFHVPVPRQLPETGRPPNRPDRISRPKEAGDRRKKLASSWSV
ncbi:hypothetical protein K0M31_004576 [Melipona bicolor]|uniref:Uncharacterized protein n=1 Tax=Melipona bicolor TaxID=60889 RepID=A0AA40FXI8_9HYME|nr:hypothetical protein K0M31_004576 [Melipona bicolor]